ncbi:MAG: hypothetical protein K5981_09035 [Clostridia bacterium]|nr:hypothetical protein [Clostridia bacterium]
MVLGIDWNGDGRLDWQDEAIDFAIMQEEMDREEAEDEDPDEDGSFA